MQGLTRSSLPFVVEEMQFGLKKDLELEYHRFFQGYSSPLLISSLTVTTNKLHQTIQSIIR